MIGTYNQHTKVWVAHGNKVLRCSPEQLRELTDDQKRAIDVIPMEIQSNQPSSKKGAQVFTDITAEGAPPNTAVHEPPEVQDSESKRRRVQFEDQEMEETGADGGPQDRQVTIGTELDETMCPETPLVSSEPSLNEQTRDATLAGNAAGSDGMDTTLAGNDPTTALAGHETTGGYGAASSTSLQEALRRSVDILDHGQGRVARTPFGQPPENETMVTDFDIHQKEYQAEVNTDGQLDVFLIHKETQEVTDKQLTAAERQEVNKGKTSEWEKLLKTGAIKMHVGKQAQMIIDDTPKERILESRFVKTRRDHPDKPGEKQIKCRWCIKGFRDPDLYEVNRQSPTLSLDALMVCLQLCSSFQWTLVISDVEGAFLQGEPLVRNKGKILVKLPPDGVPGYGKETIVELVKCVYGLCDAPRSWWLSFSKTLQELGMKQSDLDPCVYFWYADDRLQGLIALHVDDMIMCGSDLFHETVLSQLRVRYPFKHWKAGGGKFLGRMLTQRSGGSIVCSQKEYAEHVETISLTKERRKQKDEPVTPSERKKLRGVIGAANWLMGSTRPDIAVQAGLLQQRIQEAKVSDLIEANRLVGKIRDHSHVEIIIRNTPINNGSFLVATDASWANTEDLKSQAGYFVFFGTKQMIHGGKTCISPLRWKSYKQERHSQSTLGSELMSLARGVAEGNWLRSLMAEALNPKYCLEMDKVFRENSYDYLC